MAVLNHLGLWPKNMLSRASRLKVIRGYNVLLMLASCLAFGTVVCEVGFTQGENSTVALIYTGCLSVLLFVQLLKILALSIRENSVKTMKAEYGLLLGWLAVYAAHLLTNGEVDAVVVRISLVLVFFIEWSKMVLTAKRGQNKNRASQFAFFTAPTGFWFART